MTKTLRIGTRRSQLALTQTNMVVAALRGIHPDLAIEVVEITSSGDWKKEQGEVCLSEQEGGKGLFVKEIEEALLADVIDCGVHSLKDVPSVLHEDLVITCVLTREDARDAFLANEYQTLDDLPEGAVVGTTSPRRQAFILSRRPDLKTEVFRGNVPTRIEKLRSGQVDATILAMAGLNRLGLAHEVSSALSTDDMLPAATQGIVGIEICRDDLETAALFASLNCEETFLCALAERKVLEVLGGSCHTAIGAYATIEQNVMSLQSVILALDGQERRTVEVQRSISSHEDAVALGADVGRKLLADVPSEWLT